MAEQARVRLEEMIVTLQLTPGSMWTESELADLTGFGRTPVREALKRLELHHLVKIVQRRGVQITEIDTEQQLLLLETRRELERLVAIGAAQRRDADEAKRFAAYSRELREAGRRGDMIAFIRLHAEAAACMLEASRNRFAAAAIAPLHALSRRFYVLSHRKTQDLKRACGHHADVARAIAEGDTAGAASAAGKLIDYVERFTRDALRENA